MSNVDGCPIYMHIGCLNCPEFSEYTFDTVSQFYYLFLWGGGGGGGGGGRKQMAEAESLIFVHVCFSKCFYFSDVLCFEFS